jgi:phage tail sheath protein FI
LTDYDLVGSRKHEAGLFALEQVDHFDLLYLSPLGKHRDLGATSVLAAERYCSERGAMLIVDPLTEWQSPEAAISGVRELGYASPNLLTYFPRMAHRYDEAALPRAAGAALAGLLCKLDRRHGAWRDLNQQGLGFNRNLLPSVDVSDDQEQNLIRAGVNAICKGATGSARVHGSVTLGRGSVTHRRFADLAVRRSCLKVISAIDEATRWAVFEDENARLAERIRAQVSAYLSCLADMGAFESDQFIVECDAGMRKRKSALERGFAIFIAFQPSGCDQPISFTLHQSVAGSRVTSTAFAPG